jgi:hypothetical protein
MVTLVSGPDKLWASGTLLGQEEATRPHFLAGGGVISQQLGGLTALRIYMTWSSW